MGLFLLLIGYFAFVKLRDAKKKKGDHVDSETEKATKAAKAANEKARRYSGYSDSNIRKDANDMNGAVDKS
jgi:F0F1-type ATP synthase membrane subunit b/b'